MVLNEGIIQSFGESFNDSNELDFIMMDDKVSSK